MVAWRELRLLLHERLKTAGMELDQIDPDVMLSENEDILVESLLSRHIPGPLSVDWGAARRSTVRETKAERRDPFDKRVFTVPASAVTISVPIVGDGSLLSYQASTYTLSAEELLVSGGALRLEIVASELTAAKVQAEIERFRQAVDKRVSWTNADLAAFRIEAEINLRAHYGRRKSRLLADRALDAALTIPTYATGVQRPPVVAKRRHVTLERRREQASFVPEPALVEGIYQDILAQVQSWATALERTPRTASKLDEEELRDLLLGTLNTYWVGAAGGELFNGDGKTDILVREGNRNAFIGECKVWRGPKSVASAIDQLLSYLVWRDSKAALVMFIRTADPQATIAKLYETVEAHPSFLLAKPSGDALWRREYVVAADDEGRRISLAVIPVILREAP